MIYNLRKKFIRISMISLSVVFILIFAVTYFVNTARLNTTMDALTDVIASNDGTFPRLDRQDPPQMHRDHARHALGPEAPFSTRFFIVTLDDDRQVLEIDIESISAVSETEAQSYAMTAAKRKRARGWIDGYRYKLYATDAGQAVVFVDGSMNRSMVHTSLLTVGAVLLGSGVIILILIILFSKRAVGPAAESYEKQKQFITDASHELKTPLTLILTNVDIAESEVGENEWLADIRSEGERMSELVNRLVMLSRMDEDSREQAFTRFCVSDTLSDTLSEFEPLAKGQGKRLCATVAPHLSYCGDEGLIRQLFCILLENAIKYCDDGGEITVTLKPKRHPVLAIENTYAQVDALALDRLFDRFYRADAARTFDGGFGIGLSIAKSIANTHHSEIVAYKKDDTHIGFRVTLK